MSSSHNDGTTGEQIAREALLASNGYTVSAENQAVLGRFQDIYFMRNRHRRVALPVRDTPLEQLIDAWRTFRQEAASDHPGLHDPLQEGSDGSNAIRPMARDEPRPSAG